MKTRGWGKQSGTTERSRWCFFDLKKSPLSLCGLARDLEVKEPGLVTLIRRAMRCPGCEAVRQKQEEAYHASRTNQG